jgi:predicted acylesterase/phospholipase RssA
MAETLEDPVARAEAILSGQAAAPAEMVDLADRLLKQRQFGVARRLLDRASADPRITADRGLRVKVAQKRALATYKDPDLQVDAKLRRALDILQEVDDLRSTRDQETLGLAGAIYKRMWEAFGVRHNLDVSAAFYLRGYQEGVESDYGYTAINAAFVLDLLADLEAPQDPAVRDAGSAPRERLARAREIRQAIVDTVPRLAERPGNAGLRQTWWFLVTVGEAYFGLADFANAGTWLTAATNLENVGDWERESTARQLAALLRIMQRQAERDGKALDPRAQQVLSDLLGGAKAAVDSVVRGKVGLALSGGGFRASLYHLGVLARLAEQDLLRHVEFLSCVSGGSIVGAHYYLEVRRLLQSKTDAEVTRQDYVEIVQRMTRDFLAGVQRNIRTRIAAEWLTNLKMIFVPHYSRTMRAGELYEKEIYARVADGEGGRERWLNELKVFPKGEPADFRPKDHNWRRAAKVPILILNATTLNTGHNWQFTASWMGEPPAGIDSEVDANYRLRRMYYEQAPHPHNRVRLGYAVAASACVPGLFEPLPLANLYQRGPASGELRVVRPVVRLVDGGVYDNQGVAALLEQSCSVLMVSDASGQMADQDFPSSGMLGVPLRSNSVLQARIRVSQFEDLDSRRRGGLLKGLMFVHLKKGLETRPVDWIECQDPSPVSADTPLVSYGIQRSVQRRLAAIRTDLDSFSDTEAYALMASGYLMTTDALGAPILGFEAPAAQEATWPFLELRPLLKLGGESTPLQHQLKVADKLAFKVWFLMRRLQIGLGLAVLILLAFASYVIPHHLDHPLFELRPTVGGLLLAMVPLVLSLLGLTALARVVSYKKTVQDVLIGVGMATLGFLFARLHLHVFDRMFLRQGRIQRLGRA